MDAARQGENHGAVLVADEQTAGRGRRGRTWLSPPGSMLMMSVLLRPPPTLAPAAASLVTSAFACAVLAACEYISTELAVKWPNDVVLPGSGESGYLKIAGILTETIVADQGLEVMVVGMGLNTGWSEIPDELANSATSLHVLAGRAIDRRDLAESILRAFEPRYEALVSDGPSDTLVELRRRSATIGSSVRVELGEQRFIRGLAIDVDHQGHLMVRDEHGDVHVLSVGEVVHLRPGDR
jgi:BirA family biotin operon repressor/biotin-[acetyl-CoA-carboxylase] ligase